ncbi:hypothetical protein [Vibrio furnissii]|uniref:hypothetical protein n=1 Tax=Vibrio furnissii TaxID=29494 RepID=UPI0021B0D361|nr:hypothetical protein [Vibrio furnissii]
MTTLTQLTSFPAEKIKLISRRTCRSQFTKTLYKQWFKFNKITLTDRSNRPINNSLVLFQHCHITEIFALYYRPQIQQPTKDIQKVNGENNDKPSDYHCRANLIDDAMATLGKLGFHAVSTATGSCHGGQRI